MTVINGRRGAGVHVSVLCSVVAQRTSARSRYVVSGEQQTAATVDARELRAALGAFPTGVTIITTRTEAGEDIGLTANSFNSVSLDPPLVLWSLSAKSASRHAFERAEYFAIHILSAQQQDLASRFARKDVDRFAGVPVERGVGEVPLLSGCAARFTCKMAHQYQGGDHIIIVGEVAKLERFDAPALAFHGGKYALALPKGAPPPASFGGAEDAVDANAVNMLVGLAHTYLSRRLQPYLETCQLSEADYWLLSIVGAKEGRTISHLANMLSLAGIEVEGARVERLCAHDYLVVEDEARVRLTDKARHTLIELAALSKSVEMTLERGLDYAEAQLLWELLRRLIVSMIPAPAAQ